MSLKVFVCWILVTLALPGCKKLESSGLLNSGDLPAGEVRAIWLTHHDFLGKSDSEIGKLIQNLKSANINTVYLAVYSKGYAFWPSPTMKAAGGSTTHLPWAQKMLKRFHESGFWVGAWFEYGLAGGRASNKIVKANPSWYQRSFSGKAESPENGGFYFFSPSNVEVQKFITGLLTEIAKMGFDEIQLDRFRWTASSTKKATDFGYEDETRLPFLKKYKGSPSLKPKLDDPNWKIWRRTAINNMVRLSSESIRRVNPKIVISASPVGYYGVNHFLQDWTIWLKASYLDAVYPQMYAHNVKDFTTHLVKIQTLMKRAGISNRSKKRRVGAGLLLNGSNSHTVENQYIEMARNAGFHDFSLWVYNLNKNRMAVNSPLGRLAGQNILWKGKSVNPWNRTIPFDEPQKKIKPPTNEVETDSPGSGDSPVLGAEDQPLEDQGDQEVPEGTEAPSDTDSTEIDPKL